MSLKANKSKQVKTLKKSKVSQKTGNTFSKKPEEDLIQQKPSSSNNYLQSIHQLANSSKQVNNLLQLQTKADAMVSGSSSSQIKENKTGLPDNIKTGVENLSGYSLDDVKVHYNSDKPAQLNAHAYAQGSNIHLASGQEKHLPHEAWHVVQQKQGRVKPTLQMKTGALVNDDNGLEKEADRMGEMALSTAQRKGKSKKTSTTNYENSTAQLTITRGSIVKTAIAAGVAGISYILLAYGPTYAWIWLKVKISGANPNLTIAQLEQLSGNLPAYSYDDIIALGNLPHTVAEITQLGGIAAVNDNVNNLLALGNIGNRTVAQIVGIGNLVGVPAPTAAQIVNLAATNFSLAEMTALAGLPQVNNVANLIQLANINNLTAAEITTLSGLPQAPNAAEIAALAATGVPEATITLIGGVAQFINAGMIVNFLNLPMTVMINNGNKYRLAQINLALVGLMNNLLALRAFALTNQNGRNVFRFMGGTWANAEIDFAAIFGNRGNNRINGVQHAPNGQVKELYRVMSNGVAIILRSWSSENHVLATIEVQGGPRYEFKYE